MIRLLGLVPVGTSYHLVIISDPSYINIEGILVHQHGLILGPLLENNEILIRFFQIISRDWIFHKNNFLIFICRGLFYTRKFGNLKINPALVVVVQCSESHPSRISNHGNPILLLFYQETPFE